MKRIRQWGATMKEKGWILLVIIGILIVGGVYFAIEFGFNPKPIPKITWSHFSDPNDFGKNIYKRLRLEIQGQNLIFLGVSPERKSHYRVWDGFLNEIEVEYKYPHIVIEASLPFKEMFPKAEIISFSDNQVNVISAIKKIIESKERVAFILPTSFMSYMVSDNLYSVLNQSLYDPRRENKFDVDWMTFSLSGFPRNRDSEKNLDVPCDTDPNDKNGTGKLGCLILMKARSFYRKKEIQGQFPGILDQIGTKEYLGLFN